MFCQAISTILMQQRRLRPRDCHASLRSRGCRDWAHDHTSRQAFCVHPGQVVRGRVGAGGGNHEVPATLWRRHGQHRRVPGLGYTTASPPWRAACAAGHSWPARVRTLSRPFQDAVGWSIRPAQRRLVDSPRRARDNTRSLLEGYPSGQRGQTVNLLAYAFGGSNPPPSTSLSAADGTSCRVPQDRAVRCSAPVRE